MSSSHMISNWSTFSKRSSVGKYFVAGPQSFSIQKIFTVFKSRKNAGRAFVLKRFSPRLIWISFGGTDCFRRLTSVPLISSSRWGTLVKDTIGCVSRFFRETHSSNFFKSVSSTKKVRSCLLRLIYSLGFCARAFFDVKSVLQIAAFSSYSSWRLFNKFL